MQVKRIAEMGAFCNSLTFVKLPFVIKIFDLSILSSRFTQVLLYHRSANQLGSRSADSMFVRLDLGPIFCKITR